MLNVPTPRPASNCDAAAVDDIVNPAWPWFRDARCSNSDLEFDPKVARGQRLAVVAHDQIETCAFCPVVRYCAVEALKHLYEHGRVSGVWAGIAIGHMSRMDDVRTTLAAIAGLPADHYLARKMSYVERRRREVLIAHLRGRQADEIVKALETSASTVTRDLRAHGHEKDPATCPQCVAAGNAKRHGGKACS